MNRIFKGLFVGIVSISLFLVTALHGEGLVILEFTPEGFIDQSREGTQYIALRDAVPVDEEHYGVTDPPHYQPLEVHQSDDPLFEYMAYSPSYTAYFKGTTVRMNVKSGFIQYGLLPQGPGNIKSKKAIVNNQSLSVSEIFESVDLSYELESSTLTETLVFKEFKDVERINHTILWEGLTPAFEDGSIVFSDKKGKKIVEIVSPFMKDAGGSVCTDIHYELIETESGYELHKVIDEKGLDWLQKALYPVMIDPSIKTLGDAWKSSGLSPFGQYFQNLSEYINPVNGHVTVTQTDLVIPGRGLDLSISRVYTTPAVFYGSNPYNGDYEAPPTDVGKGWQLDFPFIGDKYVHVWGGSVYKLEWSGNTFENHRGTHFVLVRNGDNTYTLTTAAGVVYEFSTEGDITHIKDLDQNTLTFNYTSGVLTSITDTIGRTVTLNYAGNHLQKITYNGAEIEFSYDANGCLIWMEDFLNRRTSYSYNTGYNDWLLSKIVYPTGGYTTYAYDRFSNGDYYKYYVTDQRVYDTAQVRHTAFTYTGSFEEITASSMILTNESDVIQGSNHFTLDDELVTQKIIKDASGAAIRKYAYAYNSFGQVIEESVYYDGSTLSYSVYYAYDNWGNIIYVKNAEGHEQFFSYANTDTTGFFVDNTGTIIRTFTNAFSNNTVPASVHTALLGTAEKQDTTYVKEAYITYDSESHPTQSGSAFGNATTYLTFSGTFNEKTGTTSFPIDLTGHTVTGNGILQITGKQSDDTYQESHSTDCPGAGCRTCSWLYTGSGWSGKYYTVHWYCCPQPFDCDEGYKSVGPFTHYPGTVGYQGYTTTPALGQSSASFTVKTTWKAYPAQVQYKLDSNDWTVVTSNLKNTTEKITVPLTNGPHTLYFSESSSKDTKFTWTLYIPVDNNPDTYTTMMQYDTYGNVTSITDAESNTVTFAYSSTYSYAYLTEISTVVGTDTITTKATYDYYRGWITSLQEPEGVDAGSGYDYLYTYDVLGRTIKKEFPLLPGQSQRSSIEAVYDCDNRTITVIDQLGHYIVREFDKLGRLTAVKSFTGEFGSGTLYATTSYTNSYNDQVLAVTDTQNHTTTYTYDSLGRLTQVLSPDSSTVSLFYDDTSNKVTFTNGRGYDRIFRLDWLSRLTKVEEEYETDLFTATTYQYDEGNHLISFTDAEDHTTQYTYGSIFGLTQITYPDSTYEQYAYNNVGTTTLYTDANGNETHMSYDTLYRLTHIQYQDQSIISFSYDLNSNRITMGDNAPHQGDYAGYEYDNWNRLITETRYISQDSSVISYEYDTATRLTKLTYPDDMQVLYFYDDLNRIVEIKRYIDGSNDEILMNNIQYNTESILSQFDYGNSLQATFSHDARDRIAAIDIKNGSTSYLDLDYTHDSNSNITLLVNGWRDTDSDWHSDTESYSYDGLDRLTSASCTSWSHTYSYDKVGNRISKDGTTYTINAVNEVISLSDGTSFTYDANGNRTQKTKGTDTWDYIYDHANKLIKVEKNSETIGEYVYDGDGKRIQVTENSETKTYIYSGLNVLYEENTTGTATYVYGPTGRLAKRTTINEEINTFYYHTDHLGSTRLVTDQSRTIVTDAVYEPFGESTVTGDESYLYNGKEKDSTGLYYYGARYYDSETGRFITKDPLAGEKAIPQSLNQYTYCLNNPVKFIDPAGLTYRICDISSGVCRRYSETRNSHDEQKPEWTAYDKNGERITDSDEIENLMNGSEADQARAVYLMLLMTHPEIESDPFQWGDPVAGGYLFWVKIDGKDVPLWIYISQLFQSDKGEPATTQNITLEIKEKVFIDAMMLTVYQSTFQSINHLYHVIGHEGVHIYELATTGRTTEVNAYKWNLDHVNYLFPYPWDIGILILNYRIALNPFHPPFGPAVPI